MKCKCAIHILSFLLIWCKPGFSQNLYDTLSSVESADIHWIKQFPEPGKKHFKKTKGLKNFLTIIAGGKNSGQNIELTKPISIAVKDSNDIWIVDQGSEILLNIKNESVNIPKGFSRQKFIFQSLVGICPVPDKGVLFTDSKMNKIFLINNDNKTIGIFSDSIILNQPTGIAFSPRTSEIWVIETGSHCISILDVNGKKIKSFGARGTEAGKFNYPTSIWIDENGFAYIVDALNYRIQIFDQNGIFVNSFGQAGNASGFFARPKGIATDSYGDIYVVDALFHVVQIFDKQGHFLLSFGSQGREPGQFWMPSGIFIDKMNNIYVADTYNSRIQKFKLDNIITKSR